MSATILSGKSIAEAIKAEVKNEVADLSEIHGVKPCLAVVRVGDDPASAVYVRNKTRMAEKLGFAHWQITHPATLSEADLLAEVRRLNDDPAVDGILVQFPVPKHIDRVRVLDTIDPAKACQPRRRPLAPAFGHRSRR